MATTPLDILIHLKNNNKITVSDEGPGGGNLFTVNVGNTYPGDQRRLFVAARTTGLNGNMHLVFQNLAGFWISTKIPQSGKKAVQFTLKVDAGYSGPFIENGNAVIYPLCKATFNAQSGIAPQIASRGIRRADFTTDGNVIHIYNDQSITQDGSFVGGAFPDGMLNDTCSAVIHNVGVPDGSDPNAVGELVIELFRGVNGNQTGLPIYEAVFSSSLGSKYIAAGSVQLTKGIYAGTYNNYKDKIVASVASMSPAVPAVQIFTPLYNAPGPNFQAKFLFSAWNVILMSGNQNIITYTPGNLSRDAYVVKTDTPGAYCRNNVMSIVVTPFIAGYN